MLNRNLNRNVRKLNQILEEKNLQDFFYIVGNKKEIFKRNLYAGIARGIGIGIGVTVMTAVLVMLLQRIVELNIPVIGKYISEIVQIVEKNNV